MATHMENKYFDTFSCIILEYINIIDYNVRTWYIQDDFINYILLKMSNVHPGPDVNSNFMWGIYQL